MVQNQGKVLGKNKIVQFWKDISLEKKEEVMKKDDICTRDSKLAGQDEVNTYTVGGEAKRRWKLAKNTVLAFRLNSTDKVGLGTVSLAKETFPFKLNILIG